MQKTLILSGALAGMLILAPPVQAKTFSQGYQIRVYLPPTIGTVINEETNEEEVMSRGEDYDSILQKMPMDGELTLVKTLVLK